MKVKIKMFRGKLPSYLTVGKVYDVMHSWGDLEDTVVILNDFGDQSVIALNKQGGCHHLNRGQWEIVE